MPETVGVAFTP